MQTRRQAYCRSPPIVPGCDPDARYFRTDSRAYRFSIKESAHETYTAGWEVPSVSALTVVASCAGLALRPASLESAHRLLEHLIR